MKEPRYFSPRQKFKILKQAGYRCEICGVELTADNFEADHKLPYVLGGKTSLSNGQALCLSCNRRKKDKLMIEKNSYFAQYSSKVIGRILQGKTQLFSHQKETLLKLSSIAQKGELSPDRAPERRAAFFLIGVGCGKTIILQAAPYVLAPYMQGKKAIFLVDNLTIRNRIMEDFPTEKMGRDHRPIYEKWPLYRLGILDKKEQPPSLVELSSQDYKTYSFDIDPVDLIVVNRQSLKSLIDSHGNQLLAPEDVGLIVVDEAHHSAAQTYRDIFNYFSRAMLVFLTGTRHRGDKQALPFVEYEEIIGEEENGSPSRVQSPKANYEFTIQDAWELQKNREEKTLKEIVYSPARTTMFIVIEENNHEVEYTTDEFLEKAEKDRRWFQQCILADSFCQPVLERAMELLRSKREKSGKPHKMIIRALNIRHAQRLQSFCQKYDFLKGKVGLIHSEDEPKKEEELKKFREDKYIAMIHVAMLGEGFDEPYASISVPLCIMRSTQKAEQEFGRIVRKIEGTFPKDDADYAADNLAIVVTHQAFRIDELFENFKQGIRGDIVLELEEKESEDSHAYTLLEDYHAGEERLRITHTRFLEEGDQLVLRDDRGQNHDVVVEEIMNSQTVRIIPLSIDLPASNTTVRRVPNHEQNATQFKGHQGLEWFLLVDGEYIREEEYRDRQVLRNKKLMRDAEGELITINNNKRVKDEMPSELFETFLKGLETEKNEIEIPYQNLSVRPDEEKKSIQQEYRKKIHSLLYRVCRDIALIPDGCNGNSLVLNHLKTLKEYVLNDKKNFEYLAHGIFGYLKNETGKDFGKHQTEEDYKKVHRLAFEKIQEVIEELNSRWK